MEAGDKVRVYIHGSRRYKIGTVDAISADQLHIMVGFPANPRVIPPVVASRIMLHGKPWGPWVSVADGYHFEIEEVEDGTGAGDIERRVQAGKAGGS